MAGRTVLLLSSQNKGILLGLVGKEVNRASYFLPMQLFPQQSVCHKMDFCPNWLQPKITSPHFCQFGQLFTCAVCVASSPSLNLCEDEGLRCSPSKCAGDGVFLHWITRLSLLLVSHASQPPLINFSVTLWPTVPGSAKPLIHGLPGFPRSQLGVQ